MKIFTLESKTGDVLGIFTTEENITYTDFHEMCKEVGECCENDFFMIKDKLVNEMSFKQVDFAGGYIATKRRGTF